MSSHDRLEKLVRHTFKRGLQSACDRQQYHPVDDAEFLIDLSLGDVTKAKRTDLIEHLARCSYCRHELARVIRAEVLQLPRITEEKVERVVPLTPPKSSCRSATQVIFAAAASILIAVGAWVLYRPGTSELNLARKDLAGNRYLSALGHAEACINSSSDEQASRDEAHISSDIGLPSNPGSC